MNKPPILSDEQIDRVAEDAFARDSLLEHYVESRGHWDRIAPTIAEAQRDADVGYYAPLLKQARKEGYDEGARDRLGIEDAQVQRVKQARREVAEEIFQEQMQLCPHFPCFKKNCAICEDELEAKYLGK